MNATDSRLTCERCHGIGYVSTALRMTDFSCALKLLINESASNCFGDVYCQIQSLAAVWVPVGCSSYPVNGECPSPAIAFLDRKNFDRAAFVVEALHGDLKLGLAKLLPSIFQTIALPHIELRQAESKSGQSQSEVVSNHQEMSGEQG